MGNNNRAAAMFVGIGVVAGFLASLIVNGSLIIYLMSGVVGSFVGGYLFIALRIDLGIRNALLRQIVTATVGAILVMLLAGLIA
ncbi:MAG: GlsB/YeaQ/YmgE family stress response membrane protein [Candidatus Devosia symbiotica]|nr:GlsB/YeaQ/YmgE family stress response membrane protein [Candidatus Devosia symbiotica]